jgi:hypothetical protein
MPAHIGGVMPNPHEALTKADRLRGTSVRSLTPAREDALPQITALRQPYMLTIQGGGRSTWKAQQRGVGVRRMPVLAVNREP